MGAGVVLNDTSAVASESASRDISRYSRVERPTIVILSGLLGSGKTSIAERLIAGSDNAPAEKGAIFNEKYVGLAQEDAARIRGIETQTLGGCACCLSNEELKRTVGDFLISGRKLIVIEQSGITDGGQLRASLDSTFGGSASIKLIAVVDAGKLQAPPAILHSAILAADAVVISHVSGDEPRLAQATMLVRQLKNSPPDHVQQFAGDFSSDIWSRLTQEGKGNGLNFKLPLMAKFVPSSSDAAVAERKRVRDLTQATVLVLHPEISKDNLKDLLQKSPVLIDRAKGWLRIDGGYSEMQYALKDNGIALISFSPPSAEPPVTLGGRPHLYLLSTTGAPPSEHFISVGMPDFSPTVVDYYLSLYPTTGALDSLLSSGQGVPPRADGDALANQAFRLMSRAREIPAEVRPQYDDAFLKLLKKFVGWRLEVAQRLWSEPMFGLGPDYGERCAAVGYHLCWAAARLGKILNRPDMNLLEPLLASRPSHLLFAGLAQSQRLEIDGDPALSDSRCNDLQAFAMLGARIQAPPLTLVDVSSALQSLKAKAQAQGNSEWGQRLSDLDASMKSLLA